LYPIILHDLGNVNMHESIYRYSEQNTYVQGWGHFAEQPSPSSLSYLRCISWIHLTGKKKMWKDSKNWINRITFKPWWVSLTSTNSKSSTQLTYHHDLVTNVYKFLYYTAKQPNCSRSINVMILDAKSITCGNWCMGIQGNFNLYDKESYLQKSWNRLLFQKGISFRCNCNSSLVHERDKSTYNPRQRKEKTRNPLKLFSSKSFCNKYFFFLYSVWKIIRNVDASL